MPVNVQLGASSGNWATHRQLPSQRGSHFTARTLKNVLLFGSVFRLYWTSTISAGPLTTYSTNWCVGWV